MDFLVNVTLFGKYTQLLCSNTKFRLQLQIHASCSLIENGHFLHGALKKSIIGLFRVGIFTRSLHKFLKINRAIK